MNYSFIKKPTAKKQQKKFVDFDEILKDLNDNQVNALLVSLLKKRGIKMHFDENEGIMFGRTFDAESRAYSDLIAQAGYALFCEYLQDKREIGGEYQKDPVNSVKVTQEDY